MTAWNTLTLDAATSYTLTLPQLRKQWTQLHAGDAEPLPSNTDLLKAWQAFHAGDFEAAHTQALALAATGLHDALSLANKAQAIYANYLAHDAEKLALFQAVAARAEQHQHLDASHPNAWYWQAYALGRYSQGISIVKALAQGIGGKVKKALEKTLALVVDHADAHAALGAYHAEVIDKVGAMIGGLTYGAKKDSSIQHFKTALELNPAPIVKMEYANALAMLEGQKGLAQAEALYAEAAKSQARDAMEHLDIALAQDEVADE
jgi:hypothetical protein